MTSPLDLLGTWDLARDIDDRHDDQHLTVTGTTVLTADGPDRVTWHESGLLHRPGHAAAPVTRTLGVVRRGAGWWVVFDHGGDFHPWAPGDWVEHPCGADLYRGLVDVGRHRAWTITWEVRGPAKDYTMTSRLTVPAGARSSASR